MYGKQNWNAELLYVTRKAFLVAGMIAATGLAAAQSTIPDAQVEANVLKALAGAPELANQSIATRTVYGTVTLSGSVTSESARSKAETLAANASGVKKVVDELQLGSGSQETAQISGTPSNDQPSPMVLQSDGTYAPAPQANVPNQASAGTPAPGSAPAAMAQRNNPDADQALDQQMQQPASAQTAQNSSAQYPNQQYPNQQPQQYPNLQQPYPAQPNTTANGQQTYPQQPYGRRPIYTPGYPAPANPGYTPYGYPQQGTQPSPGAYAQQPPQQYQQPVVGGQEAGQNVTIPAGALLRVRLNRTLSSHNTPAGTTFDGIIVNDVVADVFVAIPRGASVQGKVIDAKSSGALKGRGEMSIQLTQVTLGGKVFPLASDTWEHNGGDKTIESINKTAGFGALGAIIGAVAGGGEGAAIGGGIGAAAGLGSSAASGHGQVILPAEAIIVFHTAAPAQVATVSEQEMQRLAYGVPAAGDQRTARRTYRVYPGYYPPPGYPAYGYPNY